MKKYSACGNTFLILTNFDKEIIEEQKPIFSVENSGQLDGVIFVERSEGLFLLDYFNRDGSRGEMCGNGARSFLRFLYDKGFIAAEERTDFLTFSGKLNGLVYKNGEVRVKMPNPSDFTIIESNGRKGYFLTVGVPHFVIFTEDIESIDIEETGRKIRYDKVFPKGTNVNFIKIIEESKIQVRTYERGVERETLACGTGTTACAYIFSKTHKTGKEILAHVRGGLLKVLFEPEGFFLEGKAVRID